MATYAGQAVTITALPAVNVVGNPTTVVAPKTWFMRATSTGLVPIQIARGAAGGDVETLTPDV